MELMPPGNVTDKPKEKRPTTSGKSLELLETVGLIKRKRVTLLLGGKGGSEDFDGNEEDELSDGSDDHMVVDETPRDTIIHRPQRKKRHIVSSATVISDEEMETTWKVIDEDKVYEGWEMYLSEKTCAHCAAVGIVCRSFRLQSRGPPRFACCRCHDLKRMCEFTKPRRLAYVRVKKTGRRALTIDDDGDADGEGDTKPRRKRNANEKKGGRRGKPYQDQSKSKAKKRDVGSGSEDKDDDEDAAEIQRRRKASGKRKGKGKQRQKSESIEREISVKWEDDGDTEWFASKSHIS